MRHNKQHKFQGGRSGVSGLAVVFAIVVLMAAAGGYLLYEQSLLAKASVTISLGSNCSPLKFQVTNEDSRILHGWMVSVTVTPSGSGIAASPTSVAVIPLAPQGNYNGSFSVSYNGAPPGNYKLMANLLNGTQMIAQSNSLSCTVT